MEGGRGKAEHLELKRAKILLWLPKDSFLKAIMAENQSVLQAVSRETRVERDQTRPHERANTHPKENRHKA